MATRRLDPGSPLYSLSASDAVERIVPRPLGREATGALIEAVHGTAPTPLFIDAALRASGGNPFFVEEIARAIAPEQTETRAGAEGRVEELAPDGVRRELLRRLSTLSDAAQDLAKAASVLAEPWTPSDAGGVSGVDAEFGAAEAELRSAGIFAAGAELRFRHPIIRTTIYAELSGTERATLHARAAEVLAQRDAPEEAVAAQLLLTEPRGRASTARYLASAGSAALARGAAQSAAALLQRALAEPAPEGTRRTVLAELGIAQLRTGAPDAVASLREAIALTDEPEEAAALTRHGALALLMSGQRIEAFDVLARSVDRYKPSNRDARLRMEADLCSVGFISVETAPQAAERVTALAQELTGDTPAERVLLALLAFLQSMNGEPIADAAATAECALAGGRLVGDQLPDGPALYMALDVLVDAERFELFDTVLERAFTDARDRGSLLGFASASTFRAQGAWFRGSVSEAAADAASGLHAACSAWPLGIPIAAAYLVASSTERGDLETAERTLQETALDGEVDLGTNFAGLLLFHRGRLRAAQGRLEEALADLLAQIDWETAVGRSVHGMQARAHAAPLLAARGEQERARVLAEAEWDAVRDVEIPRWPGVALRGLAATRGGDEAIELLRQSVDVLARSAARLEYARSLVELGAALRRSNRRRDARAPLREGLDLAHRCGAGALEEHARAELRAAGARPRAAALGGIEALTPSEMRIARMAAEGMSNPEIAQALFVTRKNVENHLGRAYGKLGITSRTDLPAVFTGIRTDITLATRCRGPTRGHSR
ncbi:MAG TPA: LuxR C-terminal-related transcriptional regulator [Thermoleophilaceae bacterium]|nr:LuxR C-terminal-related transcriptional regulator [Thermoleophilaceae bacterium]